MNIEEYNKKAWDHQVDQSNEWTIPVSPEVIEKAKAGEWAIVLTPQKKIPRNWFPEDLNGKKVLALASGGGQQGPILAAAGANVTVFDNSPKQLLQDQMVAKRESLSIETVEGNMKDLSYFKDNLFDLIIHPISNCFVDDVRVVWKECYRVLKEGGSCLSGFINPIFYAIDTELEKKNIVQLKHSIPYSDFESFSEDKKEKFIQNNEPFEFGHSLEDQIGGQLDAGFIIKGFYEDNLPDSQGPLFKYMNCFIATNAQKPVISKC